MAPKRSESRREPFPEHPLYIGCATWSIPRALSGEFPSAGSHRERYGRRFPAVEINSTFYRSHRPGTYTRWAATVPSSFRFALKAPKQITHVSRLAEPSAIEPFLGKIQMLNEKLGPILFQLPPKLVYNARTVEHFFGELRKRFDGRLVCEPRHPSWFSASANELLKALEVARVAADPAPVPVGGEPGGWLGLVYFRLHGSPRMYYSSYSPDFLDRLSSILCQAARREPVWCIFDNTAAGAGTGNALTVLRRFEQTDGSYRKA